MSKRTNLTDCWHIKCERGVRRCSARATSRAEIISLVHGCPTVRISGFFGVCYVETPCFRCTSFCLGFSVGAHIIFSLIFRHGAKPDQKTEIVFQEDPINWFLARKRNGLLVRVSPKQRKYFDPIPWLKTAWESAVLYAQTTIQR